MSRIGNAVAIALLVLAAGFAALPGRTPQQPAQPPKQPAETPRQAPSDGPAQPDASGPAWVSLSPATHELIFEKLWATVRDQYGRFAGKEVQWDAIHREMLPRIQAAPDDVAFDRLLNEMMASLHDSHARVISPTPLGSPRIAITRVGEQAVISVVGPGSPGEAAGLKRGMVVVSVDGRPVRELWAEVAGRQSHSMPAQSVDSAVSQLLVGAPGSQAAVVAEEPGGQPVRAVLERLARPTGGVTPPEVTLQTLPEGIAYLQVLSERPEPLQEAVDAMDKVARAKPSALILDLRYNDGGQLPWPLLSRFYATPTTVGYEKDHTTGAITARMTEGDLFYDGPVVVLTNWACMSSCDTIVTALQRTGRAKVVGDPPAGAAYWVENMIPLSMGYQVLLSGHMETLGPDRQPIEGHPAKVDYPVSPTIADVAAGRDPVLIKAVELLTH